MRTGALLAVVMFVSSCSCDSISIGGDGGATGGGSAAGGGGGNTGAGGGAGQGGGAGVGGGGGSAAWPGFPAEPVIDVATPGQVARFGEVPTGTATPPCLVEPQTNTLYPRNWVRPRFSFTPVGNQDTFELTVKGPAAAGTLTVFTTNRSWTMPKPMWLGLAATFVDQDFTLTVRGLDTATGVVSAVAQATFRVAPAEASGTIVYWTTSPAPKLMGFRLGEEPVVEVLRPDQSNAACIGCHSSTPDGLYAGFSASPTDPVNADPSRFGLRSVDGQGTEPPFLTPAAKTLLNRVSYKGVVFSPGHWATGDRIALASHNVDNTTRWELTWVDLEATSTEFDAGWGVLARTGDSAQVVAPGFSRDGQSVVYTAEVSANGGNGIVATTAADLMRVPWNNRQGGAATKVPGASDPGFAEYYPTFSPADELLAFTRFAGTGSGFNSAQAEVAVVATAGGAAHRLAANDPAACTGKTSPGLTNSWAKWGPERLSTNGTSYYWLTFSSTRLSASKPQLFITPVVVKNGTIESYPAIHVWNQTDSSNHTPAWDNFQITVN